MQSTFVILLSWHVLYLILRYASSLYYCHLTYVLLSLLVSCHVVSCSDLTACRGRSSYVYSFCCFIVFFALATRGKLRFVFDMPS